MRLTTRILSLINISLALSCYFRYPAECEEEMKEYNNCISGENIQYESEKCQNYYEKHFELLPNCKKVLSKVNIQCKESNHLANYADLILEFEGLDEKGEKCPLALEEKIKDGEEKEDYHKRLLLAAKNSCGSKKCIAASIKAYTKYYEAHKVDWEIETDEFYEALLKTLKSCDATSTSSSSADNKKNKTTTVKKTTTVAAKNNKKVTTTTTANKKNKVTTTANKKSKSTTTVSTNGRCGKGFGKCPTGKCCSKYGYCGNTDRHCSVEQGCQSEFGQCSLTSKTSKATKSNTKTKTVNVKSSPKTSTSGKCGKVDGKCPIGQCCSKYGYCGKTEDYCGTGCQSEFGKCN